MTTATLTSVRERVDALDWADLRDRLDRDGHAVTPLVLDGDETAALSATATTASACDTA